MTEPTERNVDAQGFDVDLMRTLGNGRVLDWDGARQRITVGFEASPEFCHSGDASGGGVVQGGFVTAWIDNAMALAVGRASDGAWLPASLEVKVSFFRPTHPGAVRAEAWVVRMGRSVAFTEGRLLDAEGVTLATASSTIKLVPRPS